MITKFKVLDTGLTAEIIANMELSYHKLVAQMGFKPISVTSKRLSEVKRTWIEKDNFEKFCSPHQKEYMILTNWPGTSIPYYIYNSERNYIEFTVSYKEK